MDNLTKLQLARPNLNAEEFVATRVLKALGLGGAKSRKKFFEFAGIPFMSKWELTQRLMPKHLGREPRSYYAALVKDRADAMVYWVDAFGQITKEDGPQPVLFTRFADDTTSVFFEWPGDSLYELSPVFTILEKGDDGFLVQQPINGFMSQFDEQFEEVMKDICAQ